MKTPEVKLNNGIAMPQIGFGLWQLKPREVCIAAVERAVEVGYRHFDTAQIYGNEQHLSEGLKRAGLAREDTFITTKISIYNFERVAESFAESLEKLDSDYVDLLLLHYPVAGLRADAWKKLEQLHKSGQAWSIGVSNYTVRHLEQLLVECSIKPAVNQVELHIFLQQPELLDYCEQQGIIVQAYSPLAHGQGMDNQVLAQIAQKHEKSPAQIMLRWCIEVGTVPLPKSATPQRIAQNFDIFDFELDIEDMQRLQALDENLRTAWDPTKTP